MLDILDRGPYRRPVLVVALEGWVNAGSAGTVAGDLVAGDGPVVVEFDPDLLFDYRVMRPTIDFQEGVLDSVTWPALSIRVGRHPERDVLVMTGGEPNWNWRRLCAEVVGLCSTLGVEGFVGIGGVPWAAPHTRPVTLMTTAGRAEDMPDGSDIPDGLLRVPGAAVSALEYAVSRAGYPTVGFWARVPNYVGTAYPAAAVALLVRLGHHLGITLDLGELEAEAEEQRQGLDSIAAQRPDVQAMVAQLEQAHDGALGVSGEDLAAEIERFLRDQR